METGREIIFSKNHDLIREKEALFSKKFNAIFPFCTMSKWFVLSREAWKTRLFYELVQQVSIYCKDLKRFLINLANKTQKAYILQY